MKILLIGEYSRLHNSLKEGLVQLGHDVTLVGDGDGFKNFPVDIKIERGYQKGIAKKIKNAIYKWFGIDLSSYYLKKQFIKNKRYLIGYDIVQLINERPFKVTPKIEQQLLSDILKGNNAVYLLSCGTDYPSVSYAMKKHFRYSILTPYFEGKISEKDFQHVLLYTKDDFRRLHQYIYGHIKGVVATDLDYHLPMKGHPKYLGMIPNPINTDSISYIENKIKGKIIIFHGINRINYFKKGNDLFEAALKVIASKFPDKVEIVTTTDCPYDQYINLYNQAHILMDQVYAYDQGYNALEAMAKGKVVFTGAEQEWLDYYHLEKDTVAINVEPDVQAITEKLEWLISNPDRIIEISKSARAFIEKEHHYLKIANRYLNTWKTNSLCE